MRKSYLILIVLLFIFLQSGCFHIPPNTFVRTYDEPGMWKSVEVREGLEQIKLWRTVVDTLTRKYDLEVIDRESGYVRTSWKHTYVVQGAVSERYRSRIVLKFVGEKWEQLQIKCESNWLAQSGWMLGYDTRLLEDVFGDIQGRIGRIIR